MVYTFHAVNKKEECVHWVTSAFVGIRFCINLLPVGHQENRRAPVGAGSSNSSLAMVKSDQVISRCVSEAGSFNSSL
jgi:hypothetical protein